MATLNHLLPINWKTKITEWLQEDIPSLDYGGYVVGEKETTAILFGKSEVRPRFMSTVPLQCPDCASLLRLACHDQLLFSACRALSLEFHSSPKSLSSWDAGESLFFFPFLYHPAYIAVITQVPRPSSKTTPHMYTRYICPSPLLTFCFCVPALILPSVEWHVKEGEVLKPIQTCAHVYGPVRQILIGERTALNLIARCSGIASQAHRLRVLKEKNGFKGLIAGTRKTTPGKENGKLLRSISQILKGTISETLIWDKIK